MGDSEKRFRKSIFILVLWSISLLITGYVSTLNAGAPSPANSSSALLTGMTPAQYTVPPGWSLLTTQDFEKGTGGIVSPQYIGGGKTISSVISHTGTHSLGWKITSTFVPRWGWTDGHLGGASEVYVSWYQRLDSTARVATEFYLWRSFPSASSGVSGSYILDWFPGTSQLLSNAPVLVSCPDFNKPYYSPTCTKGSALFLNDGAWHQYEIDYKPATGGQSNGTLKVWQDGKLVMNLSNYNNSGTGDMSQFGFEIGSHYTATVYLPAKVPLPTSPPQPNSFPCSSSNGQAGFREWDPSGVFPAGVQPFVDSMCMRGGPYPIPSFNYHIDDIIVLKK